MRLTKYFLPVAKEVPAEAKIASHRLMLRAGMIKQASAGIYSWLPLGFRVLKKIETIDGTFFIHKSIMATDSSVQGDKKSS